MSLTSSNTSLSSGKLSAHGDQIPVYQNSVLLESLNLVIGNKYVELFSLKCKPRLFIFLRKYLLHTPGWLFNYFFQVKMVIHLQLKQCSSGFLREPLYSGTQRGSMCDSHFTTQHIKKM